MMLTFASLFVTLRLSFLTPSFSRCRGENSFLLQLYNQLVQFIQSVLFSFRTLPPLLPRFCSLPNGGTPREAVKTSDQSKTIEARPQFRPRANFLALIGRISNQSLLLGTSLYPSEDGMLMKVRSEISDQLMVTERSHGNIQEKMTQRKNSKGHPKKGQPLFLSSEHLRSVCRLQDSVEYSSVLHVCKEEEQP